MLNLRVELLLAVALPTLAFVGAAAADHPMAPMTDAEIVASAMKAAPAGVAKDATVRT